MKEDYVSFETANLAKDKGFKIWSSFRYDRNNELSLTPSVKQIIIEGKFTELKQPSFTFAPTQSLLQKWLREIHGISIDVNTMHEGNYGYNINILKDKHYLYEEGKDNVGNYEETLEIALQKALQLIK